MSFRSSRRVAVSPPPKLEPTLEEPMALEFSRLVEGRERFCTSSSMCEPVMVIEDPFAVVMFTVLITISMAGASYPGQYKQGSAAGRRKKNSASMIDRVGVGVDVGGANAPDVLPASPDPRLTLPLALRGGLEREGWLHSWPALADAGDEARHED